VTAPLLAAAVKEHVVGATRWAADGLRCTAFTLSARRLALLASAGADLAAPAAQTVTPSSAAAMPDGEPAPRVAAVGGATQVVAVRTVESGRDDGLDAAEAERAYRAVWAIARPDVPALERPPFLVEPDAPEVEEEEEEEEKADAEVTSAAADGDAPAPAVPSAAE
jgi:hypothetical protein